MYIQVNAEGLLRGVQAAEEGEDQFFLRTARHHSFLRPHSVQRYSIASPMKNTPRPTGDP
jgi:hypothetical protein